MAYSGEGLGSRPHTTPRLLAKIVKAQSATGLLARHLGIAGSRGLSTIGKENYYVELSQIEVPGRSARFSAVWQPGTARQILCKRLQ